MTRFHSIEKIMSLLDVDRQTAKRIRGIVKKTIDPEDETLFPKTYKWSQSCYSAPTTGALEMHALNELLNGFGVEGLGKGDDDYGYTPPFEFINLGDPYNTTIIRNNRSGTYFISTWGDVAERNPALCE